MLPCWKKEESGEQTESEWRHSVTREHTIHALLARTHASCLQEKAPEESLVTFFLIFRIFHWGIVSDDVNLETQGYNEKKKYLVWCQNLIKCLS